MKKIMFNDRFGLTQAVLEGRKTVTRRIINVPKGTCSISCERDPKSQEILKVFANDAEGNPIACFMPRYRVGEVVAIAQSLKAMGRDPFSTLRDCPAWNNKMFVAASQCTHSIRITSVRVEQLWDITSEDCLREGIGVDVKPIHTFYYIPGCDRLYDYPRTAYGMLIQKISGKEAWFNNPYVFVYEFELVK